MSGLNQNIRFTVAFGPFTDTGGTYTGQVQVIGSTGYSVDDIVVGNGLYDGKAIYQIDAVTIDTPGSIATLTVSYQAGDTPDTAPSASRGQITHITGNLGLALLTQVGSNAMTPEQFAALLTSNFLKIDQAFAATGTGNVYTTNGTIQQPRTVNLDGQTFTFSHAGMTVVIDPTNTKVLVNGADIEIGDSTKGIIQSDGTTLWRRTIQANGVPINTSI